MFLQFLKIFDFHREVVLRDPSTVCGVTPETRSGVCVEYGIFIYLVWVHTR